MTALKEHKRNGNTKDKHTPLILILEKSMLIWWKVTIILLGWPRSQGRLFLIGKQSLKRPYNDGQTFTCSFECSSLLWEQINFPGWRTENMSWNRGKLKVHPSSYHFQNSYHLQSFDLRSFVFLPYKRADLVEKMVTFVTLSVKNFLSFQISILFKP